MLDFVRTQSSMKDQSPVQKVSHLSQWQIKDLSNELNAHSKRFNVYDFNNELSVFKAVPSEQNSEDLQVDREGTETVSGCKGEEKSWWDWRSGPEELRRTAGRHF